MTALLALPLFAVPALACWSVLPGLDPAGRLVVSTAAAIAAVAGTAQTMLMLGAWSPTAGLIAVLTLSTALAATGRIRRRPHPPGPPQPRDKPEADEDDWLYQD